MRVPAGRSTMEVVPMAGTRVRSGRRYGGVRRVPIGLSPESVMRPAPFTSRASGVPLWDDETEMAMDRERFDEIARAFGVQTTRRGAVGLLAGLAGLRLSDTDAKRRRGKERRGSGRRPNGRVGKEAAESICATICERLFPRPGQAQNRCLQRLGQNQAACECPSFCRRLYPGNARKQLACLRSALEDGPESLCLRCGADPDLACERADGSHICCAAGSGSVGDVCVEGACCTPRTCGTACTCGMLDPGCGLPPIDCGQTAASSLWGQCEPGRYCEIRPGFGLICCDCEFGGCGGNGESTCPDGDVLNPGSGGPSTCDGGVGGPGSGSGGGGSGSGECVGASCGGGPGEGAGGPGGETGGGDGGGGAGGGGTGVGVG